MKRPRLARHAARLLVVAAMLIPTVIRAQRGQDAGLVGTLRDATGAVLPGASVTVRSPRLIGAPRAVATDRRGVYRFLFLPPGDYDVVGEQAGFTSAERPGVTLVAGLTFSVDLTLDLAPLASVVRVTGSPMVDVHSSAGPALVDRQLLENLPLSRTVADAVGLAPGVVRDVAFGGSVRSNPLSLDGTNGNEPGWGTPTVAPNLNWVEEIQVVSLGADARYGEYTGAVENAITRSGSNRFSGLIDYLVTRPSWTGNNRGSLSPLLQERFRPLEIIRRWDSDMHLGGPLLRDRMWFFAGAEEYRDGFRPASFSGLPWTAGEPKYDASEHKQIAKITAAPSARLHLEGYYAHDSQDATGINAAPLVRPEAQAVLIRPETMWNARLLWTMSSRAFLELRHGGHNASRFTGPSEDRRGGPAGHYDQLTGVYSVNALSYGQFLSRPIATGAHLTLLSQAANGLSHEIRTGFEYEHSRLYQAEGPVGGVEYFDFDGRPDTAYIGGDRIYRPTHDRKTLYLQDGWSVAPRMTLNVGLRAGFYGGGVPTRESVFGAHSVSPRLGAAWDVTDDHRTVIRAHYGQYHDEMVTSFYDFMDPLSQAPTIVAQAVGTEFVPIGQFGSTISATIDPALDYSYAEEYVLGVEREFRWGVSGRAQVIRRDFQDSIGFIDTGTVWQPAERIDPGPDGRLGTADDGGPFTVFLNLDAAAAALRLTNPTGAYRRYRGLQFALNRRHADDVDFQLSYTWSHTVGSYNNAFSSNAANNDLSTNGVFVNPNRALNAEGRTPQDFTHEVKGLWTYRLSVWGGLNVSGVYRYQSGRTWARSIGGLGPQIRLGSVFVEPRATRHMPAVHTLDLRLEKTFKPAPGLGTVGVFADVFNVGNQGVPLGMTNTSGPNFGVPNSWQEPRSLRAGVRMLF